MRLRIAERCNRQTRGFGLGQPSPIADQVKARAGVENCPACRGLIGGLLYAGSEGDDYHRGWAYAVGLHQLRLHGQATTYYSERVANPMAGLLPNNAALNGVTIPRQSLLTAFPQYSGFAARHAGRLGSRLLRLIVAQAHRPWRSA